MSESPKLHTVTMIAHKIFHPRTAPFPFLKIPLRFGSGWSEKKAAAITPHSPVCVKKNIQNSSIRSVYVFLRFSIKRARSFFLNPFSAKEELTRFWPWKWLKVKIKAFYVVFRRNGCVHRVLRSVLSEKRPGRPSSRNVAAKFGIFDFF